jgi:hypothetical protein
LTARMLLALAFAVAIIATGLGCGGSDNTSSPQAAEASSTTTGSGASSNSESSPKANSGSGPAAGQGPKTSFQKQAEAICQQTKNKVVKELNSLKPPKGATITEEGKAMVETVLVPNFQAQINELSELSAPSDDQEAFEVFLGALMEEVNTATENGVSSLEQFERLFTQSPAAAQELGIEECNYSKPEE